MKKDGDQTRTIRGKRFTDYDKQDMTALAGARRWLNANGMREQSTFTSEEADRRMAFYAEQIAAQGQITRWLPAAPPKPKAHYRTRFAFGDALGTHMTARSA